MKSVLLTFFIIPILLNSAIIYAEDLLLNKKQTEKSVDGKISREKAIELASKEARKIGFLVSESDVSAIGQPESWNQCSYQDKKNDLLESRSKFWTIYFITKPPINDKPLEEGFAVARMDGDLCILVDSGSGEILPLMRP